ncbi:MAG: ATP-binding cassette domain-containing protein [Mycoplasmataceae bacterium]|jgi:Fe-S cluster assembly ATP-binding protein|nr:ATP-binding cassette domain-containing protein [Mycoplasmataceae bacterium]
MGLVIKKLNVTIDNTNILNNINLTFENNKTYAIIGKNGSGKSTLLKTIMNHYSITEKNGDIIFNNMSIFNLETFKIANKGVYYSAQNPIEIEGLKTLDLLKNISNSKNFVENFRKIQDSLKKFSLPNEILNRDINVNFSGGQKKKMEIIQAAMNKKNTVFLFDEIDSGLDIDASKQIANAIKEMKGIKIIVSHSIDFLKLINVDEVILLLDGEVKKIDSTKLINEIEKEGYEKYSNIKKNKSSVCSKKK